LSAEQVELFADLDRHILQTGSADGYPRLYQRIAEVMEPESDEDEDLFADEENALTAAEPEGYLVTMSAQNLAETSPAAAGEYCYPNEVHQVASMTQVLVEKAQRRATALMLAENVLVQQYMDDPSLLKPELRAQIGSFEYREIDPKELAASLVAEAQSYVGGAASISFN
jgi:hypothetical protein